MSTKTAALSNPQKCIEKAIENCSRLIKIIEYLSSLPDQLRLFRIRSDIWPAYTVNELEKPYKKALPQLQDLLCIAKNIAKRHHVRLSMHPDQFCVLASPHQQVVENSLRELEYHATVGQFLVDTPDEFVINIHLQGLYGGHHEDGISRFATNANKLSEFARSALTVENEDKPGGYDVEHVLTLCENHSLRACIDMHHYESFHRGMKVLEWYDPLVTRAIKTWRGKTPLFHVSQPIQGSATLAPHSDLFWDPVRNVRYAKFLQVVDLDIEAKGKEKAVFAFYEYIKTIKDELI